MRPLKLALFALLATLMLPANSHSADGVREINQACALHGCEAGDAPGFPVFVTEPGSYKLTGSLDLTANPNTTAIQIAAPFVTLDLNGFEIVGPKVCTGSGPTLDCGGIEDGYAVLVQANGSAAVIRNGTVRNMGADGVWGQSDGLTINNIRAINNARDGLRGGFNSLVSNSVAKENGEDGFDFEFGSVLRGNTAFGNGDDGIEIDGTGGVVDGSTANNNGNRGFHLAHSCKFGRNNSRENVNGDSCGGGICSERRRYYLTATNDYEGSEALTACTDGFHFASSAELLYTSNLTYDTVLGLLREDSGQGPPLVPGWIRTGNEPATLDIPGVANCSNWTSNLQTDYGSYARPNGLWETPIGSAELEVGLEMRSLACAFPARVWCVEDL